MSKNFPLLHQLVWAENTPIFSRRGLTVLHRNHERLPHNGHIINKNGLQPLLPGMHGHGFYKTDTYPSACTTLSIGFPKEPGVQFLTEGCRSLFWIPRWKGQGVHRALSVCPGVWAPLSEQWVVWQQPLPQHSSPVHVSYCCCSTALP